MIKFIIETVTSERDSNGNCYHFAVVTKTDTREKFVTEVGGDSNARHHARKAGLEWEDIHYYQCVVPKRQFKQLSKGVEYREPELEKFFKGEIHGNASDA